MITTLKVQIIRLQKKCFLKYFNKTIWHTHKFPKILFSKMKQDFPIIVLFTITHFKSQHKPTKYYSSVLFNSLYVLSELYHKSLQSISPCAVSTWQADIEVLLASCRSRNASQNGSRVRRKGHWLNDLIPHSLIHSALTTHLSR